MIQISGKSITGLVAIGPLKVLRAREPVIEKHSVSQAETEVARFDSARNKAARSMQALYERALSHVGPDSAWIFKMYQRMLEQSELIESIRSMIRSRSINAEYAISQAETNFTRIYSAGENAYMTSRIADIFEVSHTLLCTLSGERQYPETDRPSIIAADDLTPAETLQMDKTKILGFITKEGTPASHTAILSHALGVPAIIATGKEIPEDMDGKTAAIDGFSGTAYIDPSPAILADLKEKQDSSLHLAALTEQLRGLSSETKSGKKVEVAANVSSSADLAAVIQNDAEGIGLFRSEFIFMERGALPTEDEQFSIYRLAVETMAGKRVIIRTLDVGGDKKTSAFQLPSEDNPALGTRGIRISLTRPDIFKTQLRAILRASAFGRAAIMFPLITSVWEVWKAKEILDSVKMELSEKGIPYDKNIETGIMIETPAAALISDRLAKEVDFFSVGTNDLSQYTLVVDRTSRTLSDFFNPHHPAVLKLIEMAAESAHKAGIWIGICGELGADLSMTEKFLALGIDEFSVPPFSILPVRQKIRSME